jgi:hypothetical protein
MMMKEKVWKIMMRRRKEKVWKMSKLKKQITHH